MCEFRVYLRSDDKVEEVAEGVVKAVVDGGVVRLITLLGEIREVADAIIESVDVPNERLVLVKR
ncbi:MAG: CooT family nickel-binding protein [Candidatus Verstraetearchaeota archaeon]|jgi:predicted RNA-binding protein|nr:CooT family nickel-binding protein [Candidatus Verstraetearchaeota archaeon]NHW44688.1 CooT family nickel-binding protein [Candidatus Verstraetearchaeota archaeon]